MKWHDDVDKLDMGELGDNPEHHPKCLHPGESLKGLSPAVTYHGTRITWTDEKGWFGHHCRTGLKTTKVKAASRADKAKEMAAAIGLVRSDLQDEEARNLLISLTNMELANVVLGSGAQKLQGLKYLGEVLGSGLAVPQIDDPEKCPIGQGTLECPVCGARHYPNPTYLTADTVGELGRSLAALDEMTE